MPTHKLRRTLLFAYAITFTVLCLLLFAPAGTVRYWQAWLYLAVFMGWRPAAPK